MEKLNCILIVDDDSINNFLSQRLLKNLDLAKKVEFVNDGDVALDFIKEYHVTNNSSCPELILVDINMPSMNGFEFYSKFKAMDLDNCHKSKVVIVTASPNKKDKLKMKECGISGYIEKPVSKEKLEALFVKNDFHF